VQAPRVGSWRMDDTDIKVRGEWVCLYRAVDKYGKTIDFLLTQQRDKKVARRFLHVDPTPLAFRSCRSIPPLPPATAGMMANASPSLTAV